MTKYQPNHGSNVSAVHNYSWSPAEGEGSVNDMNVSFFFAVFAY